MINKILARAKKNNIQIDSIIIEKDKKITKKLVNDKGLHELRSCSKMVTAFAYGIAIADKKKCKYTNEYLSLETKIYPTLVQIYKGDIPDYTKTWTIRTLLTHSTGYNKMMFNEKHIKTLGNKNLLEELFNIPIKHKPNKHFAYSNVEPYLLSIFFQENFDISLSDFVAERIFKPLEITEYKWNNIGEYCAGATGLFLRYEDFHKIGQLLMYDGKFGGKQVVPKQWIKQMLTKQINVPFYYKLNPVLSKRSAGYYTWVSKKGIVFRDGSGGQYIICNHKNNQLTTVMSTNKNIIKVALCLKGLI